MPCLSSFSDKRRYARHLIRFGRAAAVELSCACGPRAQGIELRADRRELRQRKNSSNNAAFCTSEGDVRSAPPIEFRKASKSRRSELPPLAAVLAVASRLSHAS